MAPSPKDTWFLTIKETSIVRPLRGEEGRARPSALSPPTGGGAWTVTVLHRFPENKKDGYDPAEGLTWGKWGDLYGVAPYGGINGCLEFDCGTIFELQP